MPRRTRSSVVKESVQEIAVAPAPVISNTKIESEIKHEAIEHSDQAEADVQVNEDADLQEPPKKKQKRASKKKEPVNHAAFEYPLRTVASSTKSLGFHASTSGGVELACINALKQGATGFALFLKNQRQWASKPLSDETLRLFPLHCAGKSSTTIEAVEEQLGDGKGFDRAKHVIPHGSYLVNLGNPTPDKWQKAFDGFLDEVKRAEQLGIAHLNIHPGSSTGVCTREEAIASIAKGINAAHQQTSSLIVLLENMAAKGNMIGGRFQDLADIIALVEDKARIGVTLDTCHAFAYGYDLRTMEAARQTVSEFDRVVGLNYLKALHVNDSKGELESHRDLHENIGCGKIGLMGFAALMSDPRLDGLPLILETPDVAADDANYKVEIELLHRLEIVARESKAEDLQASLDSNAELQGLFQWLKEAVEAKDKEKQAKKLNKKNASTEKSREKKSQDADHEDEDADDDGA